MRPDRGRGPVPDAEAGQWSRQPLDECPGTHLLPPRRDRGGERCFRQAAEWDPESYSPHLNLAKLAIQQRRRDEALEHLNQARLRAPCQYGVLYNLASLYRQLGQTAEADRVQEAIKELRQPSVSTDHPLNSPWPRHAL